MVKIFKELKFSETINQLTDKAINVAQYIETTLPVMSFSTKIKNDKLTS